MADKVQCVACRHFSLRGSSLAGHGFGNCKFRKAHEYTNAIYWRVCERFDAAAEDVVAKRRAWVEAL